MMNRKRKIIPIFRKIYLEILAILTIVLYYYIIKYLSRKGFEILMKKVLVSILCIFSLFAVLSFASSNVFAQTANEVKKEGTQQLVEIKENAKKKLEDYKQEYGSDAYGLAAYVLNVVRTYSIPFCFLGIVVGGI